MRGGRQIDGPSSGVLNVGGPYAQSEDGVGVDLQNAYRFRIAGTQFNGLTEMVQIDGKWYQAQWQSYLYEMNKILVIGGSGQIPVIKLPLMSQAHTWTPVSLAQMMRENAMCPNATFYLLNPMGDSLKVVNGALQTKLPTVPIMTRGN